MRIGGVAGVVPPSWRGVRAGACLAAAGSFGLGAAGPMGGPSLPSLISTVMSDSVWGANSCLRNQLGFYP